MSYLFFSVADPVKRLRAETRVGCSEDLLWLCSTGCPASVCFLVNVLEVSSFHNFHKRLHYIHIALVQAELGIFLYYYWQP